MKLLFMAALVSALIGCQSVRVASAPCDLNGYSFCVELPSNLRFASESRGPDAVIFNSFDFSNDYGVYFYEGDFSGDAEGVNLVESRGTKVFGEVEYKVEIISVPDASYSILLTRNDIEFPKAIRIFTNKESDERQILEEVLAGIRGCATVEFYVRKCKL